MIKIHHSVFAVPEDVVRTPRAWIAGIFYALLALLPAVSVAAPLLINYQGRLVDAAGNPLVDAQSVRFSIHDAAAAGSELWFETQSVTPDNGIFSVSLGAVTPLPASVFGSDARYLEVKIGGDAAMTPRTRLLSTPFALYAANLGSSGTQAVISTDVVVAAAQLRLGNFATLPGAVGPGALAYNSATNRVNFWNGSVWSPLENGGVSPWSSAAGSVYLGSIGDNVGVGTASPLYKLHVAGTIRSDFGVNASTLVITGTGPAALDVAGGINAGTDNVAIVDATGRIPALSAAYLADLNGGNLTGILSSSLSGMVPPALINLSTVTTALAGKLSGNAGIPAALVDLSTVTTALGLKADAAAVLPANATVPQALINLSTVTTALAGKLSSTTGVPAALVDLSTVAALGANTFTGKQTMTASGGLAVTYGVDAGTVTLTGGITASSATFTGAAEVRGVIKAGSGAVQITNAAGNLDATKLTGNMPAISGASLTGVVAASVALITSASCDALDAASVGLFCYDTSDGVVSISTSTGVGGYASFTAGTW